MGWLSGWQYRKSHVINPASGAGTNYQIRIKVNYGSGTDSGENVYLNGHCRADFGDVRFTKADGVTLLDCWMEEKVDGNYAIFWVKVADDLSSNPATIYVYYGKADAQYPYLSSDTAHGEATFIFFDDFEVDLSKWTIIGSAELSTDYVYRGTKSVKIGTGSSYISKGFSPTLSNVALTVRYLDRQTAKTEKHVLEGLGETSALVGLDESRATTHYIYRFGTTYYTSNVARSSAWHTFEIRQYGSVKLFVIDGNVQTNQASQTYVSSFDIGSKWTTNTEVSYFDLAYIRKFVSPEPSHGAWGSEETAPVEIIVANDFPMQYLAEPATAKELKSKVSGATVTHITKDFPETLLKKGKAQELRSKWQ